MNQTKAGDDAFPTPAKSLTDLTTILLSQLHNLELVGGREQSSSFEGWVNPVPNY
jgi:hypothetical protein